MYSLLVLLIMQLSSCYKQCKLSFCSFLFFFNLTKVIWGRDHVGICSWCWIGGGGGHGFITGLGLYLERRDVGVGNVAVHILDLRQVLLGHVHKLRGAHLVGQSWESLVQRRRVVFLVVVLLKAGREGGREWEREKADMRWKEDHGQRQVKPCFMSLFSW